MIVLFFIIFIFFNNLYASEIIDQISEKFPQAIYSIEISKTDGEKILSYNSDKLLVPASSLKAITTLYAFDKLGYDYKFKTEIAYSGKIHRGYIYGDLYVVGGGDMTLGSENFGSGIEDVFKVIVDILKKNDIKGIKGDLCGYCSLNDWQHPSWEWQDIGNYYAARVTSLAINDNSYKIYFKTSDKLGGPAFIEKIEPDTGLIFENYVVTGKEGMGDNSYIYSVPFSNKAIIKGEIAKTEGLFVVKGSMIDPSSFFARNLFVYLKKNGIKIKGWKNNCKKNSNLNQIGVIYSPPLYEIAEITNKKSFNFYAESLLRFSGIKEDKIGLEENLKGLKSFLNSIGVNRFKIVDGSGLSRQNIISCGDFIKILNYALSKPYFKYYYNSLIFPGDDMAKGHIKKFGLRRNLKLRIKSGSLSGVRSYVGYLDSNKNGRLSFCFMINNYTTPPSEIDDFFEDILANF
ncbi:MAG: D-alanyl-D-alanine carboxypeptidase/D-alanyl-D-alanine-endopeptidase [Elusimicrobiota bacterium]